jgi:hypothetical protein
MGIGQGVDRAHLYVWWKFTFCFIRDGPVKSLVEYPFSGEAGGDGPESGGLAGAGQGIDLDPASPIHGLSCRLLFFRQAHRHIPGADLWDIFRLISHLAGFALDSPLNAQLSLDLNQDSFTYEQPRVPERYKTRIKIRIEFISKVPSYRQVKDLSLVPQQIS